MLKIGDFAKLSQVTVKTLRYYDEMGLIKPIEIDRFTGYRYYTFDQLPRLNRILALKDLGLSLEQVAQVLECDLSAEQLRGMLRLKQVELQQRLQEEQERLARVEARLRQIEQENQMSTYEVVIKKVEPVNVASVRDIIPAYPEQGRLWEELERQLRIQNVTPIGPCFTLYHSDEPEIDAEVCEPVGSLVAARGRLQSRQLPAVETMACVVHHGPFVTIGEAYTAILKWIEANGYQIIGPGREIYLQPPTQPGSQTDPGTVTEVQFPVEKAKGKT
jgi:DNA-binding transcriptional MerR regulator